MKSKSKERNKEQQELPKFFGSRDQGVFGGQGHVGMGGQGNGGLGKQGNRGLGINGGLDGQGNGRFRITAIANHGKSHRGVSHIQGHGGFGGQGHVGMGGQGNGGLDEQGMADTVPAAFASRPLLITAKAIAA